VQLRGAVLADKGGSFKQGHPILERNQSLPQPIKDITWKAQVLP
jgi:hypothetical protein